MIRRWTLEPTERLDSLAVWVLFGPRAQHGAQPERGYSTVLFFSFPCRARLALR